DEEPLDCEWQTRGLLFVFATRPAMEHYAATDRLLRESFAMPAKRFGGGAVVALEPALKPGLGGGWLDEGGAHLAPDRLMASWRRVLEARGVKVREGCAVRGFVRAGGVARAVATEQGEVAADRFVLATGAWTPLLQRHLGCRIPIQPGKGYSI